MAAGRDAGTQYVWLMLYESLVWPVVAAAAPPLKRPADGSPVSSKEPSSKAPKTSQDSNRSQGGGGSSSNSTSNSSKPLSSKAPVEAGQKRPSLSGASTSSSGSGKPSLKRASLTGTSSSSKQGKSAKLSSSKGPTDKGQDGSSKSKPKSGSTDSGTESKAKKSKPKPVAKPQEEAAPKEVVFCIRGCNLKVGDMVACDNENCRGGEWFHYACVGLQKAPTTKKWCDSGAGIMYPTLVRAAFLQAIRGTIMHC